MAPHGTCNVEKERIQGCNKHHLDHVYGDFWHLEHTEPEFGSSKADAVAVEEIHCVGETLTVDKCSIRGSEVGQPDGSGLSPQQGVLPGDVVAGQVDVGRTAAADHRSVDPDIQWVTTDRFEANPRGGRSRLDRGFHACARSGAVTESDSDRGRAFKSPTVLGRSFGHDAFQFAFGCSDGFCRFDVASERDDESIRRARSCMRVKDCKVGLAHDPGAQFNGVDSSSEEMSGKAVHELFEPAFKTAS